MRPLALALCLLLTGCASAPGSGVFGWWTARGERALKKVEDKAETKQSEILTAAQQRVQEAVVSLLTAPPSRQVSVAAEAADQAAALLAQVNGPLTTAQLAAIRTQVEALLSDNEALRAEGERLRAATREADAKASAELTALRTQIEATEARARAIAADNAELAALWVKARWAGAGLAALSALGVAASIALKIANGKGLAATAELLALIDRKAPQLSPLARGLADSPLWQSQQAHIAKMLPAVSASQLHTAP